MPSNNEDQTRIYRPNTFQMPNALVDRWLAALSGSEFKVTAYICRHTYGWHKESDGISLSQMMQGVRKQDGTYLDHGAGIKSKETLLTALKSLESKGLILRERKRSTERGDEPTVYRLLISDEEQIEPEQATDGKTGPPVGGKSDQGGGIEIRPGGWAENPTTQNPYRQNPFEQNTLSSKGKSSDLEEHTAPRFSKTKVADFENKPDPDLSRKPKAGGASGLQPIGNLITLHKAQQLAQVASERPVAEARSPRRGTKRGRAPQATAWIRADVERYSDELHDTEHTPQNIGQAARLFAASGLSEAAFCQLMGEARSITKGATIRKRAVGPGGEYGFRNKMPYFFKVLRDLLGMKDEKTGTHPAVGPPS